MNQWWSKQRWITQIQPIQSQGRWPDASDSGNAGEVAVGSAINVAKIAKLKMRVIKVAIEVAGTMGKHKQFRNWRSETEARDLEESMTGRRSNCVTKLTAGATRIAKLIEGRQPRERKKQNSAGSTEIKLI